MARYGRAAMPSIRIPWPSFTRRGLLILVSLASDGDLAYGLIDVGTGFPELGEVSLAMLEGLRGPRGLAVAMEPGYQPRKTLSAYVADAQRDGMVTG